MPVSKKNLKWLSFLASELKIPEEALFVENSQVGGDPKKRTHVFIWTEKLNKDQLNRLTSSTSAGSYKSLRGRLFYMLDNMNADGWLTSVKPSKANLEDLHPISPLSERDFCLCGEILISPTESRLGKCYKHLPNKKSKAKE